MLTTREALIAILYTAISLAICIAVFALMGLGQ